MRALFLILALCLFFKHITSAWHLLDAPAHAQAPPPQAHAITPPAFMLLSGEIAPWWRRALAWYAPPPAPPNTPAPLTDTHKRAQMRQLSRDLGRGCYGCHERGFKGYTDRGLISAQMMAISAEHGVGCGECHLGERGLSELGARSLLMWRYTYEAGLDCADCHPQGERFKALTPRGEREREGVQEALKRLSVSLGVPLPPATP